MSALDLTALLAVLATPVMLLHARGLAEATIAIAGLCFLVHAGVGHDWGWLRRRWLLVALVWWGWLVICSLLAVLLGWGNAHSLVEGIAIIRFLIFAAALEHWVLRESRDRRWLFGVVAAAAAWIAAECVQQLLTGYNLFGDKRGAGGAVLTGPFRRERAGPPLSRIIFPVLVPAAAVLLRRRRAVLTLGAYALLPGGVFMMVLIGQRMPLILTGFGLLVAALLLPRLRPVVLAAGIAGVGLLAGLVALSPPTYFRLVVQFSALLQHFPTSPYGQIYARGWHIAAAHPLIGAGFDGFRNLCPLPRYFGTTFDGRQPDGGGVAICTIHPHNFYLQALIEGGFPGLILFVAAAIAWLLPLASGLWRNPVPLRVALFVSILIQLWPIASSPDFVDMPMGGWFFLLLGWGLAEARWCDARPAEAQPTAWPGRAPPIAVVLPPGEGFGPGRTGAVGLNVHRLARLLPALVLGGAQAGPPFDDVPFRAARPPFWLPGGRNARYAAGVARTLRRDVPAMIEVHNRVDVALSLARRFPRTPVTLFLLNDPQSMRQARTPAQRAELLARLAQVITISDYLRARLLEGVEPPPGRPPVVLPIPIELAELPAVGPRDKLILFVGRVVPEKGVDAFVAACALALPRLAGWRAEIIGADRFRADSPDTPHVRAVRAAAATAGVHMLGYRDHPEVLAALTRASIAVVPSRWAEPFGLAALEAMACGAVLLCSRRGGLPEVAGDAAVFIDPDDPAGMAAAITALVGDPARLTAMGEAGRRRALQFGLEAAARRLAALRQEVLTGGWPGGGRPAPGPLYTAAQDATEPR